jgi:hypothetical protein
MARALQFIFGWIILVSVEFLRVYFIMPFGSQQSDTIDTAYFLHNNILYLRVFAVLLMVVPAIYYLRYGQWKAKSLVIGGLVIAGIVVYLFNFQMAADKMFYQPVHKIFARTSSGNRIEGGNLVVGVYINGQAKAYPIELIGYHHQVRDSVGGKPVMVTYCTVCRTGRVFSPLVDGKDEKFRLVGMDHFNAMFEDATTGSWWQQATGEAVAGTLKGKTLAEIPSEQTSLEAWVRKHPESLIMQPDPDFQEEYDHLKNYDEGKSKGDLTRRDSLSWNEKSWVVGVTINGISRAYDWNDVVSSRVINDTLGRVPIVISVEDDSSSFHVWKRDTLTFYFDPSRSLLNDVATGSTWSWDGICQDGTLQGRKLPAVQSYQEFWHSWRTFRPGTTRYTLTH